MANQTIDDKTTLILDKANKIKGMEETPGWSVLSEMVASIIEQYPIEGAVDWGDYKFRLGIKKGIGLLEEMAGLVIARAGRAARGKKEF